MIQNEKTKFTVFEVMQIISRHRVVVDRFNDPNHIFLFQYFTGIF